MQELKIPDKVKNLLKGFVEGLKDVYKEELISVVLYGSGSSGEFTQRYSNLNVLIVLVDNSLETLKKASGLVNKFKFRIIRPLFFTEKYIQNSTDVFPIEFLDIKENYYILFGRDLIKDINVATQNLRFQCEQELKLKLLNIKQFYLRLNKNSNALKNLLFKSVTSVLHILRMSLRFKGKQTGYPKEEIIKDVASLFKVDVSTWQKILAGKNREIKLSRKEIEDLLFVFVRDLENIIDTIDAF